MQGLKKIRKGFTDKRKLRVKAAEKDLFPGAGYISIDIQMLHRTI
jgi:hypothetical protein